MALSRMEKGAAGLTAAFVLVTGGWFLRERAAPVPYQVQVSQSAPAASRELPVPEPPEEETRPETLLEGETIDINAADVYDLQRLPGIGEKRAQAIAAWREEHGPFQSVEDLTSVPGIGEGIVAGLREYAEANIS